MNLTKMLVGSALIGLLPLPSVAQQRQVDRRVPPDVSLSGVEDGSAHTIAFTAGLSCIQRIADQATGGCLLATSVPTPGRLFPPPHDGGVNNVSGGAYSFIGGGLNNTASGTFAVVAGGYVNSATGSYWAAIGGGGYNEAGFFASVAGGSTNTAAGDVSFVGGGYSNRATGALSAVAGGSHNTAQGDSATVAGGYANRATADYAAIGGGRDNRVPGEYGTVAGGRGHATEGDFGTVGGGNSNRSNGSSSTVPGGFGNSALGDCSFAAGRFAMASHDGAFVWADSQSTFTKTSSLADEFNVYASGGARFFSNSAATTGVLLAPGGGSWTAVSDRAAKENVEPVDAREVLERVLALPISTWNYRSQADSIRHMGPMAQDFHAAFGLGLGETTIDTIDPDGVAFAAIQGLNTELEELRAANLELRERLERLESLLGAR